jgi:glycosyltransferase involved in cell wall biosynthesis
MATIAFDVSYIQRQRTGYGRFSLELLKSLIKNDKQNRYLLHGWSHSLDTTELQKFRGENVELKIATIPGFIKRMYWNTIRAPKIETVIGSFDIFHGAEPMLPPTANAKIATLHDLSYKRFPQFFQANVLRWDRFVQRSLIEADIIIVPSQNTRKDAIELFRIPAEKIVVVYIPISGQFSSQKSVNDENVRRRYGLSDEFVFFSGTMEPRKNIPFIIRGFEKFQKNHSGIQLVLAGKKGWLSEEIFKAMERSPSGKSIKYLDFVSEEDLCSLYRSAICFVYPSLYEGFGLPVLEAMASGTPVITSKTSSLGEIAGDASLLIEPTRIDEFLNALETICGNSNLRNELVAKGLERVKQFSHKNAADTIMGIYRTIETK